MIAIAMGHAPAESVVPVDSKKPETKSAPQKGLLASKTWKDYKSLHTEAAKVAATPPERDPRDLSKPIDGKLKARLRKARDQAEELRAPLRELFLPDTALATDLASWLGDVFESAEEMHRPKPGRRPQPDLAAEAALGFTSLQRSYRIVEAFQRLGLKDDLIENIREALPRMISRQRHSLRTLAQKDPTLKAIPVRKAGLLFAGAKNTDSLNLAAMEADLARMETQWAAWKDADAGKGSRPPRKLPDQAALDHSSVWTQYVEAHRSLHTGKTGSDPAVAVEGIRKLEPGLMALLGDDALTGDLVAWPEAILRAKQAAADSLRDSRAWPAIAEAAASLRIRFRIAKAFRERDLSHPLIGTMASRLPIETGNLKGELKAWEADHKAVHAKEAAEIKAFVKSSEAEFAAWKKKPR